MGVDAEMYFHRHAALPLTDDALTELSYRLAEAVGQKAFWLSDTAALTRGDRVRALNRVEAGDYFVGDRPGDWLKVGTLSRYYGPGYERGPLWQFIAIAEWLERNLVGDVYYGGDSGEQVNPWPRVVRDSYIAHWAQHGGRPYFQSPRWREPEDSRRPTCPLCERPATQYGTGAKFASWSCDACGRQWVWAGGEEVRMFDARDRVDSFTVAQAMRAAEGVK